ncbi:MAG: DUF4175 family protein [Planctomycetes bacterium]|nr:DUF4175 family protein [Planctomycetota bacterium]
MKSIRQLSWLLAATLAFTFASNAFAQGDDIRDQQERQRQVQAQTEQVVKRITTMLRVMQFYGVESGEVKKQMEEMSGTLSALSKEQMQEVIRQLEAAAVAKTEKQSEEAFSRAKDNHRKVLDELHALSMRFSSVKSLDKAADDFDRHAKQQMELHLRSTRPLQDLNDLAKADLPATVRQIVLKRMQAQGDLMIDQSHKQKTLHGDVNLLIRHVHDLAAGKVDGDKKGEKLKLNEEQQTRVKAMDKLLADYRLTDNLSIATQKLLTKGFPELRRQSFLSANDLQWKSAQQMREIARVLRVPGGALDVLKEASKKVEEAIAKQEELKQEIAKQEEDRKVAEQKNVSEQPKDPNKLTLPGLEQLPKLTPAQAKAAEAKAAQEQAIQNAANADKNAKLADKQAQIAFDTKDTANLVKPFADQAAKNLEAAEKEMKAAKENLIKSETKKAADPQAKATDELKLAKAELDKMIAAAEKAKVDPLAAVKSAIEKLDNIIQEQTKNRDETKATVGAKQNLKLPDLADQQKQLAKKTDDVKNTPLPNKAKVENALDKATEAMKQAAKNLDAKKSPEAVAKQDQALDNLKQARNELVEKTRSWPRSRPA